MVQILIGKKNPVSSKALYDCSLGKPHGRWALLNGVVNDSEIIAELRGRATSSAQFKRRRSEQNEDELRRLSQKSRKSETYANDVLQWGVGMYNHCNSIHKLLENLATNQGVPMSEIPPPPVPPPARPPSPCRDLLASPHPSVVHIMDSSRDPPSLCAQEHADNVYLHDNSAILDVSARDMDMEPAACSEGMFGGFFSENVCGNISLSLMGSPPATT